VVSLITVVVAQLSWRGWVSGINAILRGEGIVRPLLSPPPELQRCSEVRARLRDLGRHEYRRFQGMVTTWDPDRLARCCTAAARGDQVIVVSTCEPYLHEHGPNGIVVKRPASGLVTRSSR